MECVCCRLSEARVTVFMMHTRRLVAINTPATATTVITEVWEGVGGSSRVLRGAITSTASECGGQKERELGRDVRWWLD